MTEKRSTSRTSQRMFPLNQPVAVQDLTGAFKANDNEEGTYLIQHGGQPFFGTARRGHSLERLVAAGQRVPTLVNPATTEPWIVTCISPERLEIGDGSQTENWQE